MYFEYDLFEDFGVSAQDICCTDLDYTITSISSNEPDKKNAKQPSFSILSDTTFLVQAQRDGSGSGRTYTISFDVTDCFGNVASSGVYVEVPHDQS